MRSRAATGIALSAPQFEQLRDLLASYCGVYIDESRRRVIEQALSQRLQASGATLSAYLRQVSAPAGRAELQQLSELALNHETFFFRNGPQFEALRSHVLPALHRVKPPGQALRLWSAGCASGEEAYSLAICALESLGDPLPRPIQILASDLSAVAVERARQACYSGRALAQVGPATLARYFEPLQAGGYRVREGVRRLVRVEQRNLLEPFPPSLAGVDVIFCENVTIYFRLETCRDLIDRFYQALPEGGMLFLGFSETLWQVYDRFQLEQVAGAFVYVKRERELPPSLAASRPEPLAPARAAPRLPAEPAEPLVARRRPEPRRSALEDADDGDDPLEQARAHLDAGEAERALHELRRVSPASPRYPQALALVAHIHADRGDLDTAVAEARRAIDVDPLTDAAYLLLGLIALRQSQAAEAIAQLERARYLNSASPFVRFHLAEAYRQAQRGPDARREYTNALQALEGHGDDEVLSGVSVSWLRQACRTHIETEKL